MQRLRFTFSLFNKKSLFLVLLFPTEKLPYSVELDILVTPVFALVFFFGLLAVCVKNTANVTNILMENTTFKNIIKIVFSEFQGKF